MIPDTDTLPHTKPGFPPLLSLKVFRVPDPTRSQPKLTPSLPPPSYPRLCCLVRSQLLLVVVQCRSSEGFCFGFRFSDSGFEVALLCEHPCECRRALRCCPAPALPRRLECLAFPSRPTPIPEPPGPSCCHAQVWTLDFVVPPALAIWVYA